MCPECGAVEAHDIEECPESTWYSSGPTGGACQYALLHTQDGLAIQALPAGSVEYYEALQEAVDLMHATGSCPL